MSGRFFLDTNVFVYEFDTRDPHKTDRASNLIRSAILSRQGVVSYQVVQEFFSVAFTRFQKPLGFTGVEEYFSTVFKPLLAVHSSPRLLLEALRMRSTLQLSSYDSRTGRAETRETCP